MKAPAPSEPKAAFARHGWAWVPVPLLLATILALWVADLRTPYESRALMVLLNVVFTWLASLCICVLTARGFLASGQPGLLMFGCGALVWGATSLAAAAIVDRVNPTITIHNVGVLAAAICHFIGLLWVGRLARPARWLVAGYAGALMMAALVFWAATAGATPRFFVQGQGGTLVRQVVLLLSVALFAWVAWQMLVRFRRQAGDFYYWYGLGLALTATGLVGVFLLSVQGGILGWTNRLTQYLGCAYLFVAAWKSARETGAWQISLETVEEAWRKGELLPALRQQPMLWLALRYGFAVVIVAAAVGLRLAVTAWFGPGLPMFITFYPVVMLTALLCGFGPGLVATALAGAITAYWFFPPAGSFTIASPVDRLAVVMFSVMGLFMSAVAELYRRNKSKAAAYDRDQALRETRREKEFLVTLLENAEQPFAVGYPDGRLGRLNRAFEQLTGYTAAELRALDWSSVLTPPEWREMERQKLDELNRTGQPVRYQKEYLRKDGSRVRIELLVHLVRDAAGKPDYYYSFLTDITARKRVEDDLERTRNLLTEGQRIAHLGSWEYVAATQTTIWSDEEKRIYGLDPAQPPPSYAEMLRHHIHPDDAAALDQVFGEALRTGSAFENENRIVRPDGSVRFIYNKAQPCFDETGRLVRYVGATLDLTERKQAEAALRESEELFRVMFTESSLGKGLADPATRQIVQVNAAFCQMLGYSQEEMRQRTFLDLHHPEDCPRAIAAYEAMVRGEIPGYQQQKRYLRADGSVIWVDVVTHLVRDAAGRPFRSFALVQDITARKLAEREREITVELLRLVNQCKSLRELVRASVTFFRQESGCEAVGVRLREEEDFPYFETHGFPAEFVQMENHLCARDSAGRVIRDSAGHPIVECMCGNVICGRFNPVKLFFTVGGSFWTNSTTDLLATSTETDRQARTRNRCNGEGYESVALVALSAGGERLGLLQLNDKRPGRFTPEMIALWERLAGYLAVAVAKLRADETLRESNQELEQFNRVMVGRELRMIELKKEINAVCIQTGQPLRYPLDADPEE